MPNAPADGVPWNGFCGVIGMDSYPGWVEDWRCRSVGSAYLLLPVSLWECLTIRTVNGFPAPATSHVACGFPALRAPAHFTSKFMRPVRLERLPGSAVNTISGTPRRVPAMRTAVPCSTASSRSPDVCTPGPDEAGTFDLCGQQTSLKHGWKMYNRVPVVESHRQVALHCIHSR